MNTYFSYFCINSSTCNIPGQAKISQLTNFPVAIMNNKDISCSQISVNYLEGEKEESITLAKLLDPLYHPSYRQSMPLPSMSSDFGKFFNNPPHTSTLLKHSKYKHPPHLAPSRSPLHLLNDLETRLGNRH